MHGVLRPQPMLFTGDNPYDWTKSCLKLNKCPKPKKKKKKDKTKGNTKGKEDKKIGRDPIRKPKTIRVKEIQPVKNNATVHIN